MNTAIINLDAEKFICYKTNAQNAKRAYVEYLDTCKEAGINMNNAKCYDVFLHDEDGIEIDFFNVNNSRKGKVEEGVAKVNKIMTYLLKDAIASNYVPAIHEFILDEVVNDVFVSSNVAISRDYTDFNAYDVKMAIGRVILKKMGFYG